MNQRVRGRIPRLDRVLAVIAANGVALVAGVVQDGSSGACTATRPARRTARADPSRSFP
jgi:hypothetical protein